MIENDMKGLMQLVAKRITPPSLDDITLARQSAEIMAPVAFKDRPMRIRIEDTDQTIELPAGAVSLLINILQEMSAGHGITLIPAHAELTTVQAAEILNVSRPFLINLLEEGKIPYHKVGTHRRILMDDVMRYKEDVDQKRRQVLDELVEDAQENNMGY